MANAGRRAAAALVAAAAIMMVAGRANAQDAADSRSRPRRSDHCVARCQLRGSVARGSGRSNGTCCDDLRARRGAHRWVDGAGKCQASREWSAPSHRSAALARDGREEHLSARYQRRCARARPHPDSGRASHLLRSHRNSARRTRKSLPIPLGDVIAHEVGHLVLGTNSHSRSGIMRAYTDVHSPSLTEFSTRRRNGSILTTLIEPTAAEPAVGN